MTSHSEKPKIRVYTFTLEEVHALYRLFERQWISKDDEEAKKVIDRITQIAWKNELASRHQETT